jgi:hypothetical protein
MTISQKLAASETKHAFATELSSISRVALNLAFSTV